MKCHVLVDLEIGELTHADTGQIALNSNVKNILKLPDIKSLEDILKEELE